MVLTTTPTIEGHPILEYKQIVTGETIIGANVVKDFFAGIRDIVGGRSKSYEGVLREGKETALREMMERNGRPERLYAHGCRKRNRCSYLTGTPQALATRKGESATLSHNNA